MGKNRRSSKKGGKGQQQAAQPEVPKNVFSSASENEEEEEEEEKEEEEENFSDSSGIDDSTKKATKKETNSLASLRELRKNSKAKSRVPAGTPSCGGKDIASIASSSHQCDADVQGMVTTFCNCEPKPEKNFIFYALLLKCVAACYLDCKTWGGKSTQAEFHAEVNRSFSRYCNDASGDFKLAIKYGPLRIGDFIKDLLQLDIPATHSDTPFFQQ